MHEDRKGVSLPTHLVMFDAYTCTTYSRVHNPTKVHTSGCGYHQVPLPLYSSFTQFMTLFHTHFLDNKRVGHHITICLKQTTSLMNHNLIHICISNEGWGQYE